MRPVILLWFQAFGICTVILCLFAVVVVISRDVEYRNLYTSEAFLILRQSRTVDIYSIFLDHISQTDSICRRCITLCLQLWNELRTEYHGVHFSYTFCRTQTTYVRVRESHKAKSVLIDRLQDKIMPLGYACLKFLYIKSMPEPWFPAISGVHHITRRNTDPNDPVSTLIGGWKPVHTVLISLRDISSV